MFRKRRFKRWTLGRLQNFTNKRSYAGKLFYSKFLHHTSCTFVESTYIKECLHY